MCNNRDQIDPSALNNYKVHRTMVWRHWTKGGAGLGSLREGELRKRALQLHQLVSWKQYPDFRAERFRRLKYKTKFLLSWGYREPSSEKPRQLDFADLSPGENSPQRIRETFVYQQRDLFNLWGTTDFMCESRLF